MLPWGKLQIIMFNIVIYFHYQLWQLSVNYVGLCFRKTRVDKKELKKHTNMCQNMLKGQDVLNFDIHRM